MSVGNSLKILAQLTPGEEVAPERLDLMTRQLREQMRQLSVESVDLVREASPRQGAMGEAFTVGALLIAVLPTVVPQLINFLKDWKLRGKDRVITIEIVKPDGAGIKVQFPDDTSEQALNSWIHKIQQIAAGDTSPTEPDPLNLEP